MKGITELRESFIIKISNLLNPRGHVSLDLICWWWGGRGGWLMIIALFEASLTPLSFSNTPRSQENTSLDVI